MPPIASGPVIVTSELDLSGDRILADDAALPLHTHVGECGQPRLHVCPGLGLRANRLGQSQVPQDELVSQQVDKRVGLVVVPRSDPEVIEPFKL